VTLSLFSPTAHAQDKDDVAEDDVTEDPSVTFDEPIYPSAQEELDKIALLNDTPDDYAQDFLSSEYYVSIDDGSDGPACGLVERTPCKSIWYVEKYRVDGNGDTIHIAEGDYTWDSNVSFAEQPNRIRAPYDNLTYIGAGEGLTVFDAAGMPDVYIWTL